VLAGFQHIDRLSFVSPKHVKQMADSEELMAKLNASLPAGVKLPEIIGIVVNEKDRTPRSLLKRDKIGTLTLTRRFFGRANATLTQTNRGCLSKTEKRYAAPIRAGDLYFDGVWESLREPWGPEIVVDTLEWLKDIRVRTVRWRNRGHSFAAVGRDLYDSVKDHVAGIELGVHLHSRPRMLRKNSAAYEADAAFDAHDRAWRCPFAETI